MEELAYTSVDGVWLDGLQFCSQAYRLFERLMAHSDGPTRLRTRTGPFERKLITEILPLAHYLKSAYSLGRYIDVCWHSGNQPYDAEFRQRGEYVEQGRLPQSGYFEITTAQHPDEHLARERLATEGFLFSVHNLRATATKRNPDRRIVSEPVVFSNGSFVDDMARFVLNAIEAKAAKGYSPGYMLIVQCTLNHLYLSDDWNALADNVRRHLPESDFHEIWMCADEMPNDRKAILKSSL